MDEKFSKSSRLDSAYDSDPTSVPATTSAPDYASAPEFGGLGRKVGSIWPGNRILVTSSYSVPLGEYRRMGESLGQFGDEDSWDRSPRPSRGSLDELREQWRESRGRLYESRKPLGIRIVHLSDLQGACFGAENTELLERVAECDPHFVVVTGDLVDRRMAGLNDFEPSIRFMGKLQKIAPTFFTYGNHERAFHPSVVDELRMRIENLGVTVLDGESTTLELLNDERDKINIFIAGLEEELLMVEGKNRTKKNSDVDVLSVKKSLESMVCEAEGKEFNAKILMAHEPQFIKEYSTYDFDLIFSGHAHGGQIRLPGVGGLFSPGQGILPKLTSGVHPAGEGKMIISRGLGNSSFPFRFFNRPEIVVVNI